MANLVTPTFRASYLKVFKAEHFNGDPANPAKFSVSMIFPEDANLNPLKKAAIEACEAKWPGKGMDGKIFKTESDQNPFRNGDDKDDENYTGCTYINAKASEDRKPVVVGPDLEPIVDMNDFVSGDYARAQVSCYAYEFAGKKGVAFGLLKIQKMCDGEPLGDTGGKVEDCFSVVEPSEEGEPELF